MKAVKKNRKKEIVKESFVCAFCIFEICYWTSALKKRTYRLVENVLEDSEEECED